MIDRWVGLPDLERRWQRGLAEPHLLDPAQIAHLDIPDAVRTYLDAVHANAAGDLARAIELLEGALDDIAQDAATHPGVRVWHRRALLGLSAYLGEAGARDDALVLNEQVLRLADEACDIPTRLLALNDRGMLFLDDAPRCAALFREALEQARAHGDAHAAALALGNLAEVPGSGVTDGELARAQRSVVADSPGLAVGIAELRVARALHREDVPAAATILCQAPRPSPDVDVEAHVNWLLAASRVALADGRADEAVVHARDALAAATPFLRLSALERLGACLEDVGDLPEALATERLLRVEERAYYSGERSRRGQALDAHFRIQRAVEEAERAHRRAADLATLVATLEEQADELRESGLRDPLTGLRNRRYLADVLAAQVAAAVDVGAPVGVAVIDLDCFKALNDGSGHPAGDEALRAVTRVLLTLCDPDDVAMRVGGDEFVVVRIGADGAAGLARALAGVDGAVADAVAAALHGGSRVGASVGIAGVDDTLDAALALADERMYASKPGARRAPYVRLVAPGARSA